MQAVACRRQAKGCLIVASRQDIIAGLLMVAFGALVIWVLIPLGVAEPKSVKFAALSPSYYPRIAAGALMLLGVGTLVRAFAQKPRDDTADDRHPNAVQRTVAFLAILLFLALTLNWLGFVLGCSIAVFAAMTLAGERKLWLSIPIAVLLPLLLYLFFLQVAYIPIPLGILAPLLAGL